MSGPFSPQKKRRISTSPIEEKRVTAINEQLKKNKPDFSGDRVNDININNNISNSSSINSNNNNNNNNNSSSSSNNDNSNSNINYNSSSSSNGSSNSVRAITTTQNSPNQSLTTAFPKLSSTPTKSLTTLINTNTINSPSAPPSYLNMSIGSGGGSGDTKTESFAQSSPLKNKRISSPAIPITNTLNAMNTNNIMIDNDPINNYINNITNNNNINNNINNNNKANNNNNNNNRNTRINNNNTTSTINNTHQKNSSISSTSSQQSHQLQMLQNLGHLSQQDLLIKLVKKEEEVQNLLGELHTLSQTLAPEFSYEPAYRKKFLDPAINALFRTMKMELEEKDKTIENLKRELDGVGFTPNSITGKKLVEKLRTLQNENEELGRQLRQGRVEQYEVEIALQRKVIEELKIAIKKTGKQSIVLEEEMERLQDLLFQMHAKVNRYEKQYGPLESDNTNTSSINNNNTNNNNNDSTIMNEISTNNINSNNISNSSNINISNNINSSSKNNNKFTRARPERKNQRDDFTPSTQQIDDV